MKTTSTLVIFFVLFFISFSSCNFNNKNISDGHIETIGNIASDTTSIQISNISEEKPTIGKRIYGDFNGDGVFEYAYAELTKEAEGDHPLDGGTPAEYTIKFTDSNIPTFPAGCCEMTLINEGDLNGDGSDEISIFQAPINGCSYDWRTVTYTGNGWKDLLEMGFFPSIGCDDEYILPFEELQDIVTLEEGVIYRRVVDVNDETGFYRYIEDEDGIRFDFTKLKKEKANIILDSKQ